MSRITQWLLCAASALLWIGWLGLSLMDRHELLDEIFRELTVRLASVVTISWVLTMIVGPIARTARGWFEIGKRVQCQDCACDSIQRATKAPVIPLRLKSRGESINN